MRQTCGFAAVPAATAAQQRDRVGDFQSRKSTAKQSEMKKKKCPNQFCFTMGSVLFLLLCSTISGRHFLKCKTNCRQGKRKDQCLNYRISSKVRHGFSKFHWLKTLCCGQSGRLRPSATVAEIQNVKKQTSCLFQDGFHCCQNSVPLVARPGLSVAVFLLDLRI